MDEKRDISADGRVDGSREEGAEKMRMGTGRVKKEER
jgi:hypothetical protein